MRFPLRPSRRVSALIAAAAAAIAALAAAAWLATPGAGGLSGRVEARLQRTRGRAVTASAAAPIVREAVVATEDERFYRHHGIDVVGILRALPYDLTHFSLAQGASTITEQVAKLLYLSGSDHTPWRKLEDAALALKLEGRYTKEQILAAYLNSVYFGEGAYGIGAASRAYFGVAPGRVDTAQASLLAGLIQAPSLDDPRRHPQAARTRQAEVLRSLVRNGFLTAEEAAATLARPLALRGGPTLPAIRGVALAPGPAFVWWKLVLAGAIASFGIAVLIATRLPRFRRVPGRLVLRIASLALVVIGIGVAIRAFRTA